MLKQLKAKRLELLAICLVTLFANVAMNQGSALLRAGTTTEGAPCDSGATTGELSNLSGDTNGDGALGLVDVTRLLRFLFTGGEAPVPHCDAASPALPFDDEQIATLTQLLDHLDILELTYGNRDYLTVRFKGVNVQVVSGQGATNGYTDNPFSTSSGLVETNGLGNLIIGYNELRNEESDPDGYVNERVGSHNLIVGHRHNYTSFGSIIGGRANGSSGAFATIAGGNMNSAEEVCTVIAGGSDNLATAPYAQVSGGRNNVASALYATVAGGGGETAEDGNLASAAYSSVSGGRSNEASGEASAVSGGLDDAATDIHDWVAGDDYGCDQ